MALCLEILSLLAQRGALLSLDLRRSLGAGAYFALGQLEEEAWVRGEWVTSAGARLRRYHLTERGRARLAAGDGSLALLPACQA